MSFYLSLNYLQDANQSGVKVVRSTDTALLTISGKLLAAISVVILLDLSAEFDTVNPELFCPSLWVLEFVAQKWQWFASYIEGQSYQVTWKGSTFASRRFSTGVPQSSVLVPLLFSLYTRSLSEITFSHGFSCHCYANNTQLVAIQPVAVSFWSWWEAAGSFGI